MSLELFESTDYKAFLNAKLDEMDGQGRGARARMSKVIGCHTAYTAQVLRGSSHFSLEQGEAINDFLGHTESQGHYFLLLIQIERAGSEKLKKRFAKELQGLRDSHSLLKNRLDVREGLAEHEQITYYSSWIYGAVHALVSIPGYQSADRISQRLGIGALQAGETVEFLLRSGLLERGHKGELRIGKSQIHLGSDSPLISKHHMNWRLQAMRSLERGSLGEVAGTHYSSVISISKGDAKKIREKLVEALQTIRPIIHASKEEALYALSLDFFEV